MDVLLGIRPAATPEDEVRLQARLKAHPGLTQKAMDAYELRVTQSRTARTRMQNLFAEALTAMDEAYEQRLMQEAAQRMRTQPVQAHKLPSMEYMVDYRPCAGQFEVAVQRMTVQYTKYQYVPTKSEAFRDPFYDQRGFKGDEVLRRMREVMDSFPDKPTAMQKRFLEATFSCMAPLVYGDEYTNDPE
jgi:hypothetical protein